MIVAVDFDGTIVEHDYPEIGKAAPGAIETLKRLQDAGHRLILFTMRSANTLANAVAYLAENGIQLFAVNENPEQKSWSQSPKVYANAYIDDAAIGCPLMFGESKRPFVNWVEIERILITRGFLKETCTEKLNYES